MIPRTCWLLVPLMLASCAAQKAESRARFPPAFIATASGCLIWDPYPVIGETADWSGACVDGKSEGQGILVFRSTPPRSESDPGAGTVMTSRFEGDMHDGKNASGTLQVFDRNTGGRRYTLTGRWRDDRLDGYGHYADADGVRYDGDFVEGRWEGQGDLSGAKTSQGLARYRGRFENGRFDGDGIADWSNGNRYIGQFRSGLPDGTGTMILVTAVSGFTPSELPLKLQGHWQDGCFLDGSKACIVTGQ